MGLGADVVLTPHDQRGTFFDAAGARADVDRVQAAVAGSLGARDERPLSTLRTSPSYQSRVARRPGRPDPGPVPRAGRPVPRRPGEPQGDPRPPPRHHDLRIEAGGDLYFAFEQAPTGVGEALGLAVAIVILLLAFGSIVAMGLPMGPRSSASQSALARCRSWRTSSTSPAGRS